MRLSKTLPEDIEEIIASGDLGAVARAVEGCQIGAYLRRSAYEPRLMHFPASQEITAFLLERGEDINSRDRYEQTPVHWRVMNRRVDQIPYLVSRGADINARDRDDRTPLFDAVRILEASDVERMISWGANARVVAKSRFHG